MNDKQQDQNAADQLSDDEKQINISVIGDINLDTVVLKASQSGDRKRDTSGADKKYDKHGTNYLQFSRVGGSLLLANAVYAAFGNFEQSFRVFTYCSKDIQNNNLKELQISLSLYPKESVEKRDRDSTVYRMDRVPGWVHDNYIRGDSLEDEVTKCYPNLLDNISLLGSGETSDKGSSVDYNIVVIHERDLGFRCLDKEKLRKIITDNVKIILSVEYPLETLLEEKLWKLIEDNYENTVILVDAVSLRQEGINIREAASIEQTIRNFFFHLEKSTLLKKLCRCRHLLVHFIDGGVLHYDRKGATFHFCPFFESDAESFPREFGSMIGFRTILTAAITKGIACAMYANKNYDDKDIAKGIYHGTRLGVLLSKCHFRDGFTNTNFKNEKDFDFLAYHLKKLIRDFAQVNSERAKELKNDVSECKNGKEEKAYRCSSVASLPLPRSYDELADWSRVYSLREHYGDDQVKFEKSLCSIVREGLDKIVITASKVDGMGPKEMWFPPVKVLCPYVQFGSLKTAHRAEIDSLIGITAIIRKYLGNKDWKKPLSIAIFGPPGSGKGYTIKQILKSLNPSAGTSTLEYNVAQFISVKNLTTAFHQAQDKALSEEVPLIIFDEFDSSFDGSLGWLKYFLAPMQDGKFKGDDGTFQVGRAIFVFAGGTSYTFEDFCKDPEKDPKFKDAKGPDFISRLRGYLNIGDINPEEKATEISDILMFRRAIVLRSILEEKAGTIFDLDTKEIRIDDKVTKAFLKIMKYKHGVRSMEAIIEMANFEKEEGGFLVASLPPPDQLHMHVDSKEFLEWVGH